MFSMVATERAAMNRLVIPELSAVAVPGDRMTAVKAAAAAAQSAASPTARSGREEIIAASRVLKLATGRGRRASAIRP
jgi:hypothetical protein